MRFSTIMPLLLAAGVANAQFGKGKGGQGGQGQQGQGKGGQGGQGQAAQNQNGQNGQNGQNNNNNNNNNNAGGLALDPNNVQENSNNDGLADAEAGQAASATDPANFINFCTGQTLTNGLQVKQGSCNGIPMGKIPAANQMVSAIMIEPTNNQVIDSGADINFQVKINNLQAGKFTNPDNTYYAAPQDLQGGQVVGHTHITVQDLGGQQNPTEPLDAETFAFFKGINDAGDGNGLLAAPLAGGLPDGEYRVCSMTSASNHQPVLMPVAQRGPQDDCVRFTVGNAGGNNNNNNNNNQNQNGQGKGGQGGQGQQGQAQQGQGKGGQGAQGQQGQGQAAQGQQGQGQQGQAQAGQGQAGQGQAAADQAAQAGQGQGAQAGQGQGAQAGQGQGAQAGQGQGAQAGQGQAGQGKGGQGGFGGQGKGAQGGGRRGRKNRFASRHFLA